MHIIMILDELKGLLQMTKNAQILTSNIQYFLRTMAPRERRRSGYGLYSDPPRPNPNLPLPENDGFPSDMEARFSLVQTSELSC